jgi:hypothetical protein
MVSLDEFIDGILQGFIANKLRFILIELSQELLHKLFPLEEMLFDLSFQLINPSFLYLLTNSFFINELIEFILNPHFNFLFPWMEDIIDLGFNYVDVGLIESLMLLQDFINFINNHFLMLCHHLRVFKVVRNQVFSELKEEHVFIPLFKGAVLGEPYVAIGEIPEFLGILEPVL